MIKKSTYVGSRELKTRLGKYLARVRRGEIIVVTYRGEPVAELRPVQVCEDETEEALRRMAAQGIITRGTGAPLRPFKPIRLPSGVSASDEIIKDREERF